MKKIKVLSVYRALLLENRGTPLRVKSIINYSKKDAMTEWHTCTLDNESPLGLPHITVTHDHVGDIKKIIQYVRQHNIDVVVFHSIAAAFYMPFIKMFTSAKMVLEMHGFREEEELLYGGISKFKYMRDKLFYRVIYRLCDLITTCSISATEYLGKFNKNVVSVYGGVDLSLFNPDVVPGNFFERKEGDIIVGYAGDGKKWQGLPFLFEAFDVLVQKYPQFKLELLLSEKRTIPERAYIHVTGAVPHDKVSSFTAGCDVLVIPRINSRVNTLSFPSKFMEYMAMGKAVVASRTGDMFHVITHGENGLLFEPEDIETFIAAMEALIDPLKRERLGKNAYKTAREGYTWEVQGAVFLNALKRVVH